MTPSLLHLCARATAFPALTGKLTEACDRVTDWDALLMQAEAEGLGPLLHWHLSPLAGSCPEHLRRAARLLYLRHQHINIIYAEVLRDILGLLHSAGIETLVLKGAALCHTLYPEIGLRPMRDIDLLLRKEQSRQAQDLLIGIGFTESNAPRPADHFHLPSLHKKVKNIPVCIELHHGLFPDCPPYYRRIDFGTLLSRALTFDLNGLEAYCPGNEDMLWHVFEHGLHMPLTYEPCKLIAVADIVTLVETRHEEIDWQKMQKTFPKILAALPFLHHLTPWQEQILTRFSWKTRPVPARVGETFHGWPHLRLSEQKDKGFFTILHNTFLPSEWWCRVYYGIGSRWTWIACRWLIHPQHVFWWIQLYSAYLAPQNEKSPASAKTKNQHIVITKISRFIECALSLARKILHP